MCEGRWWGGGISCIFLLVKLMGWGLTVWAAEVQNDVKLSVRDPVNVIHLVFYE